MNDDEIRELAARVNALLSDPNCGPLELNQAVKALKAAIRRQDRAEIMPELQNLSRDELLLMAAESKLLARDLDELQKQRAKEWHENAEPKIQRRIGGLMRHSKDPKQADKAFVFECWQAWQKNPIRYESKEAFAIDMLEKCDHLKSRPVIVRWCKKWENTAPK